MLLQFSLKPREPKFFARGIGLFEKPVGVECEDISRFRPSRRTWKVSGRKNSQWHVRAFQLRYGVGFGGKMQNGRMAGEPDLQRLSIYGKKTKGDEHIRLLQGVQDFVQPREKMSGFIARAQ